MPRPLHLLVVPPLFGQVAIELLHVLVDQLVLLVDLFVQLLHVFLHALFEDLVVESLPRGGQLLFRFVELFSLR